MLVSLCFTIGIYYQTQSDYGIECPQDWGIQWHNLAVEDTGFPSLCCVILSLLAFILRLEEILLFYRFFEIHFKSYFNV